MTELLRDYMKLRGCSQASAAADIGITVRALYSYMLGERMPRATTIKKIFDWSNGRITADSHQAAYEAFHGKV